MKRKYGVVVVVWGDSYKNTFDILQREIQDHTLKSTKIMKKIQTNK